MAMSIVEPVTYLEEVIRTVSAIPYTLSGTPIMKNHLAFSEFFLGPLQFVALCETHWALLRKKQLENQL